ncbi:MAG: site-specific integrase [Bacteroidia bacterium]|nr:site-specific integrase [Bacteroidia bacterium]
MNKKKSATATDQLVKLRKRLLPSGNTVLFLDYIQNGERMRESLGLTLLGAKTVEAKQRNKATMVKAENARLKKEQELLMGKQVRENQGPSTPFLPYYRAMVEDRHGNPDTQGNWGNWRSCLRYLEVYCTEDTTFADITPKWVQGFKNYLDQVEKDTHKLPSKASKNKFNGLSQSSKVSYFNKLKACLNKAFKEHVIDYNPADAVQGFRVPDTERQYLTIEEVKSLMATECKYPQLKRAFLFGCLTGLRKSDILKLTWGEVQKFGPYTRLVFKQKKTGGQEYLDIPDAAVEYLGNRGDAKADDLVFRMFKYSSETSLELRRWALQAGITKDFTFHCSRHTFAVLLLNSGTDIYTVSKLLGHRELATTQIYAHLIDQKKQDAVSRISNLLGDSK